MPKKMANRLEIRTLPRANNQLRAVQNSDGSTTVSGYAIVFNQPSQPLPFIEYIARDALDGVDLSSTLLLYAHDYNKILARADSGTLKTSIDEHGLKFTATMPNTTLANDTRENIKAGNVKGCSFGFTIADNGDRWDTRDDGTTIHYVDKIDTVSELTLTPIPAYNQTSVQVQRDMQKYLKRQKEETMTEEKQTEQDPKTVTGASAVSDEVLNQLRDMKETFTKMNENLERAMSPKHDCRDDEEPDDSGADDGGDGTADDSTDVDETDDASSNSASPASTASSAVSSASATSSAASSAASQRAVPASSEEPEEPSKKEEKRSMQNITPSNAENNEKQQLRDFKHFLLTREVRPSLLTRDGGTPTTGEQGVGLQQGQVLIPETIMAADHETHQFPRLRQYVHTITVPTPTGKQPYFDEQTATMQTKKEFDHAKDFKLSDLKFINWDVQPLAAKIVLSRELLMEQSGGKQNWLTEAQQQMQTIKDNTDDSTISQALVNNAANKITATDAVNDMKTVLNVNLKPKDSSQSQIVLSQSAYNALDLLKDGFGRPLLQPDPTSATSNLLFGKPVIVIDDTLLGKAGEANAIIAPLFKSIYNFEMGQVTGQFIDNFDIFQVVLGVMMLKDVECGRPDLVNLIKLPDKALAASNNPTVAPKSH